MNKKDDWRLNGQEEYLSKKRLAAIRYIPYLKFYIYWMQYLFI